MDFQIYRVEFLLLVAAIVSMVCHRLRFSYTVGLVLTGVGLSLFPTLPTIALTSDLLFSALLPPLIFEASSQLSWKDLSREMPILVPMASIGLLLAALVTAFGMHYFADWPLLSAGVFGILIAATDPVSVIATFKESGITGRLRLLVEADSLFNDGAAAVGFTLLMVVEGGKTSTTFGLLGDALWIVGGGILCGGSLAAVLMYVAGKTVDHLVEITLTTIAAYGSYMFAEHFHASGVLATLTAGLVMGSRSHLDAFTKKGQEAAKAFWEFAAFISNSLIFLMIGIHEAKQNFWPILPAAGIAILLVLVGRVVVVYPIAGFFNKSQLKIPVPYQHVMFWGGLRGALALAFALGLPPTLAYRDQIVSVCFAVVAFSIVAQGLSMAPMLRRLGLLPRTYGLNANLK